jgi:hypothetical protein
MKGANPVKPGPIAIRGPGDAADAESADPGRPDTKRSQLIGELDGSSAGSSGLPLGRVGSVTTPRIGLLSSRIRVSTQEQSSRQPKNMTTQRGPGSESNQTASSDEIIRKASKSEDLDPSTVPGAGSLTDQSTSPDQVAQTQAALQNQTLAHASIAAHILAPGQTNLGQTNLGQTNLGQTNLGQTNQIQTNVLASQLPQASVIMPETTIPGTYPSAPIRQISFRIAADSSSVDVQVAERAGRIQIAVRTQDTEVARSLQSNLGELVGHLEDKGFRTEPWTPVVLAHGAAPVREPSNPSNSQGGSDHRGSGGRQPDQRQGQHQSNQRQQACWKSQIEDMLSPPSASPNALNL